MICQYELICWYWFSSAQLSSARIFCSNFFALQQTNFAAIFFALYVYINF